MSYEFPKTVLHFAFRPLSRRRCWICQVTGSALVNLSRSGFCSVAPVPVEFAGRRPSSHFEFPELGHVLFFWSPVSPRNNTFPLSWLCKPFAKRLKLAGQTKGRFSTTGPSTPPLPIKSLCVHSTRCPSHPPPFFYSCFFLSNPNDCAHSPLFHFHSVIRRSSNGFVSLLLLLFCRCCCVCSPDEETLTGKCLVTELTGK